MSHREKVAWNPLGTIAITFVPYLAWMSFSPPDNPLPDFATMGLFAVVAVSQGLGAGVIWLRIKSPEEAGTPADERDRAIAHRSKGVAYYILIGAMILVGCIMPLTTTGWHLVNAAVAGIVLAEVVQYGIVVWCYRRGWND